jgi:hypothetical protein
MMEHARFPGWRDGKPRIITQGILDGDAVVYELFPMQTVVFDGRLGTFQSIPLPIFESEEHRVGVLSLMTRARSGFNAAMRVRIWIQNACASNDDPQLTFATDETSVLVQSSTVPRHSAPQPGRSSDRRCASASSGSRARVG